MFEKINNISEEVYDDFFADDLASSSSEASYHYLDKFQNDFKLINDSDNDDIESEFLNDFASTNNDIEKLFDAHIRYSNVVLKHMNLIYSHNSIKELFCSKGNSCRKTEIFPFKYRVLISEEEGQTLFSNNYNKIKEILTTFSGRIAVFQEEKNPNEIILGIDSDENDDSSEKILISLLNVLPKKTKEKKYDGSDDDESKENMDDDSEDDESKKIKFRKDKGKDPEDKKISNEDNLIQLRLLIQEEVYHFLNTYEQIKSIENFTGVSIKAYETNLPSSNETLLLVKGNQHSLYLFLSIFNLLLSKNVTTHPLVEYIKNG